MSKKGTINKKKVPQPMDPTKKEIIRKCRETEDMDQIILLTHNEDVDIRHEAVKQLCPCNVQKDIDAFWQRVFQMTEDDDARIRQRILHILCDGSPPRLQDRVMEAVRSFNGDKDPQIRRQCHKVIASYERTGKWNIM